MEKALFIRGNYPINPRSYKIGEVLKKKYHLKYVFFDRKHLVKDPGCEDFLYYQAPFRINNKIKKTIAFLGLYKFLKKTIKSEKPDIVFTYHWDMFVLTKFIIKDKNIRTIYDVSDIPNFKGLKFKIIKAIEEFYITKEVDLIFASRFFEQFYEKFPNKKIVIDNKPVRGNFKINHIDFVGKHKFSIIYVGNIKYKPILRNLVDAVKELDINLLFFGSGVDEDYMKEYCKNYKNVCFFGRFSMKELPSIYKLGDISWAAYPSERVNVKYAISNKYFESLVYKVPCIFARETELGKLVESKKLGFTVNPYNKKDIKNLINDIKGSNELSIVRNSLNELKDVDLYWESESKKLFEFI